MILSLENLFLKFSWNLIRDENFWDFEIFKYYFIFWSYKSECLGKLHTFARKCPLERHFKKNQIVHVLSKFAPFKKIVVIHRVKNIWRQILFFLKKTHLKKKFLFEINVLNRCLTIWNLSKKYILFVLSDLMEAIWNKILQQEGDYGLYVLKFMKI